MRAFHILLILPIATGLLTGCSGASGEATDDAPSVENSVAPTTTTAATNKENPGYIDCIQAPEVEPTSFSLDCTSDTDQVIDITWETWDATEAIGTGIREQTSNGTTTKTAVVITLSNPIPVTLGWAFSERDVESDTSATSSASTSSSARSNSSSAAPSSSSNRE
ncbi:MAG: hypothetical protein Q3976_00650 [Corynebacterium sp.]|nr:hypothetical protein [Corynebacterium sp.]